MAAQFFAAVAAARGDTTNPAIGPQMPELFGRHGIDPIMVRLFPVSYPRLGAPSSEIWTARRAAVERALTGADAALRTLGERYLDALSAYERESRAAGGIFVEMQNTMLFATVGQKAS